MLRFFNLIFFKINIIYLLLEYLSYLLVHLSLLFIILDLYLHMQYAHIDLLYPSPHCLGCARNDVDIYLE